MLTYNIPQLDHSIIHKNEMMSDIDYKYKCDACNHIFQKSDHLARHKEDNHLNNKKNILICKTCFKSFVNLKYLKAHSQRHLENRSKMCVICKLKFVDLKRHILLHTGKDRYKCSTCDKSFSQKKILKDHNLTHTDVKTFICNKCEKLFVSSSRLKSHEKSHISEKQYKCIQCVKIFKTSSSLRNHHLLKHTMENPYKCQICDKAFSRQGLKYHMLVHNGLSKEKPYSCQECKKCFRNRWKLKAHMFHHSGELIHKCKLCQKAFPVMYELKSHIRHAHTKPYKCDSCDQCFSCKKSLKRHQFPQVKFKRHLVTKCIKQQQGLKNLNTKPISKKYDMTKEIIEEEGELGDCLEEGELLV